MTKYKKRLIEKIGMWSFVWLALAGLTMSITAIGIINLDSQFVPGLIWALGLLFLGNCSGSVAIMTIRPQDIGAQITHMEAADLVGMANLAIRLLIDKNMTDDTLLKTIFLAHENYANLAKEKRKS